MAVWYLFSIFAHIYILFEFFFQFFDGWKAAFEFFRDCAGQLVFGYANGLIYILQGIFGYYLVFILADEQADA